jgi:DNA-binding LacI/PurR family transcriptional regulator
MDSFQLLFLKDTKNKVKNTGRALMDNLYENVREKICDLIYNGAFPEGKRIPAERNLSEQLGVSRVTLRKALDILSEDGLIRKDAGSGNVVQMPNHGNAFERDMVVLIAPAQNSFFSSFIRKFQEYGQKEESMILYVEKPQKEDLANSLYRLYRKGLRNAVVWPDDCSVDHSKIKRLRAMGMNLVFFDSDLGLPYADCVTLNNNLAVKTLLTDVAKKNKYKKITYIGWDTEALYSCRSRENAFRESFPAGNIVRLSWVDRNKSSDILARELFNKIGEPGEIIFYGNRECGIAAAYALDQIKKNDNILAGIDDIPSIGKLHTFVYRQNLNEMVSQIFKCLDSQIHEGDTWKASVYPIAGQLIEKQ